MATNFPGIAGSLLHEPSAQSQQRDQRGGFLNFLRVGTPVRDVLGLIGDTMLMQNGFDPIYRQRLAQQRQRDAFGAWNANPDDAEAQRALVDRLGPDALQLIQQRQAQQKGLAAQRAFAAWAQDPENATARANFLAADPKAAYEAIRELTKDQREGQFTLGEGQQRYDAMGRPIASGPAPRPRYYPVPQGGRLELDPSYQGPVSDAPASSGPVPGGPRPGQIVGGYRFKGGNPNDPNAWEAAGQGGASQPGSRTFP